MSHFLHRKLNAELAVAQRGEGVYLFDSAGKQYRRHCRAIW
jgi:hypothetical protein